MRNAYLVSYDVSDDRRLRKMHGTMMGYGEPMQYSVFWCELSLMERALMISAVTRVMNQKDDRLMVVDLGPSRGRAREAVEWLGRDPGITERRVVVV